ncbi:carbohydrate-binding protein [Streptomyces xinghaiensis]|uniref:carbohydrate-binding protein n=1 Tax=Streptomyces xinghaiensis TaxID=1038928 RepID=UPI002E0E335C|nr:carbohydrate-binding protein [Streptomyces xinghaiensis]
MTAGNNGAGTPENDDPFAYLYRSEGGDGGGNGAADGGTAQYGRPAAQPGVPRTSYNQVHRVGERQYGGQQAAQRPGYGPGAAPADQPTAAYAQSPHTSYAAPETLPGGAPPRRAAPAGHGSRGVRGGGGRGPNSQGLLIGAIAVVAVVVIGIVIAMLTNGDGDEGKKEAGSSESLPADGGQDQPADEDKGEGEGEKETKPFSSDKFDAVGMKTAGGATVANDVEGARSKSGAYIAGMNQPGATATWRIDVPKAGKYTFYIGYGVPGKDTKATLLVNGKDREQELKNWANAKEGEWDKGWTTTYSYVNLTKGTNTLDLTCGEGQGCEFNLDWVQLKEGHVKD